ncbi:DUF1641 domain-containing protein [Paraburkholderia kururiensis]|uniref:DUF1641 domain-containing protein n=1 Tax=Paraburkholderia kururiensis TaxID=984307 RepID=UPI0039A562AA
MAERIHHDITPPKIGTDAHEELERLLQSLHEHGVLRFANDVVCAKTPLAEVLVGGLQKEGTLNALQNLSILLMALSRIPPARFYKIAFALQGALDRAGNWQPEEADSHAAPGVTGAYRMLHDDALWEALLPLIEGLKAFAQGLEQEVEKPISTFTGKPSSA